MNNAHLHLIVNHLPIVGVLVGMLVLLAGLLLRKSDIKMTALGIFVFSAIGAAMAFYSGEGAEETVENIAGVSETLIGVHEEYAELFFILALILGAVSLVGIFLEYKKFKVSIYLMWVILCLAIANGVAAKLAGTSGGEIRHTEIRSNAAVIPLNNYGGNEEEEDDD